MKQTKKEVFSSLLPTVHQKSILCWIKKTLVVVNFDFFVIVVAIRATSVTGQSYFIDDMADLWLWIKKKERKKTSELKCSQMLRTCRWYRNEDNDLKVLSCSFEAALSWVTAGKIK